MGAWGVSAHAGGFSVMSVREPEDRDWSEWLRMRCALWPDDSPQEHERGMREWRSRGDAAVFLALRANGSPCGFVEVGTRQYADGCLTSPVGYIEGWYVDADVRRQGIGRALLRVAESWARARGYREMASDARLDNTVSHAAHARAGYAEVERLIVFRKSLGG